MNIKPKRPRIEKTIKLIDIKMYEDYNQKKPDSVDPNQVKSTPKDPPPNSGIEGEQPKVEEKGK
jgi:hypothetical protein